MSTLNPKHLNWIYWAPLPNNVLAEKKILYLRLFGQPNWHGFWKNHIYRWALHGHSCETTKGTVFLEIDAAFPHCDWLLKKSRIISFGPTSVHREGIKNNPLNL